VLNDNCILILLMDQVFREGKRKRRMNKKKNKGIKAIKEK
jgi:hypothetical protein